MIGGIDLNIIASLAAIALLAGFFDAIAGGGGLITLPALLLAGIEPMAALATNKLQAATGSLSATAAFSRKGLIEWRAGIPMALMAFFGGITGALSVSFVPKIILESIVPVLLILVALYFALAPKLNNDEKKMRIPLFIFSFLIVPLLGFYDGIFGPGTGSFFMISFVLLVGQGVLRAMSNTKLMNASSNLGALLIFASRGAIIFPIALTMAMGAFVGAQLGARCAVKFGPKIIKPLLIVICCSMAIKLLTNPQNPLTQFFMTYINS